MTMNYRKLFLAASATAVLLSRASAQGTFQNLDFELATVVPVVGDPDRRVQFAPAFSGWTGYIGTNLQGTALYNRTYLDSSAIALIDSGWPTWPGSFGVSGPYEGNFGAILQAGVVGDITNPQNTTLSQV